ncbi:hypothetical protein L0938_13540 [Paracidovorax citrulli]
MIMDKFVFHLFYVTVAIIISRTCAVILARRAVEKTAGEEVLAKLPLLASRDIGDMQDTFYGCVLAIRTGSLRRPATMAALVQMCLWGVVVALLLMMAVVGIIDIVKHAKGE